MVALISVIALKAVSGPRLVPPFQAILKVKCLRSMDYRARTNPPKIQIVYFSIDVANIVDRLLRAILNPKISRVFENIVFRLKCV